MSKPPMSEYERVLAEQLYWTTKNAATLFAAAFIALQNSGTLQKGQIASLCRRMIETDPESGIGTTMIFEMLLDQLKAAEQE